MWNGFKQLVMKEFLKLLNTFYPFIRFTIEVRGLNINFVGLTVSFDDGHHEVAIFRSKTVIENFIDGTSFCLVAHKLETFNSFVRRLVHSPTEPPNSNKEHNILKHLVQSCNKVGKLIHPEP